MKRNTSTTILGTLVIVVILLTNGDPSLMDAISTNIKECK